MAISLSPPRRKNLINFSRAPKKKALQFLFRVDVIGQSLYVQEENYYLCSRLSANDVQTKVCEKSQQEAFAALLKVFHLHKFV
jgi:hypothetical protein